MDVPRFPAPPASLHEAPAPVAAATRSVSLDCNNELPQQYRQHRHRPIRRPRSASWLVARKQNRRNRRTANVQPLGPALQPKVLGGLGCNYRMSTEFKLTMTEERNNKDHPPKIVRDHDIQPLNDVVIDSIREAKSHEPRSGRDDVSQQHHHHRRRRRVDDTDVICSATSVVNKVEQHQQQLSTPTITTSTTSDRLSPVHPDESLRARAETMTLHHRSYRSTAIQTADAILYRLRVFPTLKDIVNEEAKPPDPRLFSRFCRLFRFIGRLALCQFGLAWLLTLWAILGAGAFYVTEGPRERQQVTDLRDMQRNLAVSLATELRQLRIEDKEIQPIWSRKVQDYVAKHEKLLLAAINTGYSEGGDKGQLWTLPGCVLFAIAVLTTLGFGAPVPRTSAGRSVAVVFAAIGIPAHFLLVLNLGLLFAVKLKRYGILKRYPECRGNESIDSMPMPMWVKVVPFVALGIYYIIGIFCFGVARLQPFSDALLFPLDFTAAGGLSKIAGYIRVCYGLFLEGAVIITAFAVAVLKVSATQSLTNIGLKYGLLTPA